MVFREFNTDELLHVVDSHHGVYSYSIFAERYIPYLRHSENIEVYKCLTYEDNNEDYFDIWSELSCEEFVIDGKIYQVIENEGIYLAPLDMEIPEDFFI